MCVRESQACLTCLETGERQKAGFLRPVKLNGGRRGQAIGQVRQQKTNKPVKKWKTNKHMKRYSASLIQIKTT